MRQIRLLDEDYLVTVAGFGEKPDASIDFVELVAPRASLNKKLVWGIKLLARRFDSYYWNLPQVRHGLRALAGRQFDLLIANDVASLPLALELAGGKPVLVDSHEYSPREFEDRRIWQLLFAPYSEALCARYLPRAAVMTTVCQRIADEYQRVYGVASKVVYNAPSAQGLQPSPVLPGRVRLVHHGAAIRSRHLGLMIEMMLYLDERFVLDIMIVETDPAYMAELRTLAAGDSRIKFVEPVALESICQRINEYDVGLFLLPPVNFNYRYALPNKFFEFVQARLAIAVGPSAEMASLVNQYSLGVVADSFAPEAMATALVGLTDESIATYKLAADRAARDLNFEAAGRVWQNEIRRLVA